MEFKIAITALILMFVFNCFEKETFSGTKAKTEEEKVKILIGQLPYLEPSKWNVLWGLCALVSRFVALIYFFLGVWNYG